LRKASFGLAFEEALSDFARQTFLGLAVCSEKPDHSLRVKSIFGIPAFVPILSDDEITFGGDRLHQVKAPLLPLGLLEVASIGKPQRNHKIDGQKLQ
jgi:hypothetical protein